jgi:hypothetical protein
VSLIGAEMTDKKDKASGYPPERRVPAEEQNALDRHYSNMYSGGDMPDRRKGRDSVVDKKSKPIKIWTEVEERALLQSIQKVQSGSKDVGAIVDWDKFLEMAPMKKLLESKDVDQIRGKLNSIKSRAYRLTTKKGEDGGRIEDENTIHISIPKKKRAGENFSGDSFLGFLRK